MKRLRLPTFLLAALLVFWQLPLAAQTAAPAKPAFHEVMADQELLARLQKGGYVLYLRHGYTDNSRADQFPNVDLADCNTQRLLNDQGRSLMRDVGKSLRKAKIPLGEILVSPMCRTLESARLAIGDFHTDGTGTSRRTGGNPFRGRRSGLCIAPRRDHQCSPRSS